jgi:hypothetical protein
MKTILLLTILLSSWCNAQTKVIAYKSHSGNSNTFAKAYQKNMFNIRSSNFGHKIQPLVRNARLDSLIFINDTCQIMVTSKVCSEKLVGYVLTKETAYHIESSKKEEETYDDKKNSVWKAGRDTVYNHYLFSHNESLEWIKERLKKDFYFRNSIDSTVFLGYTNNKPYEEVNPFIKINMFYNNTIDIHINGIYGSNCAMGLNSGYTITWGIEYQKSDSEEWEIVLPLERKKKACGLPFEKYLDKTISLDLLLYWKQYNSKLTEIPKGKYKLFAEIYKTKERIYSNEFEVK